MKDTGCIYILTNPSFKEYVKIGYATNLEKRLKQLNRSETIPYAFRAYAIYEVDKPLTDKELHKLIDRLNPDLRTIDNYDGKERVKEFFLMSPEDAYAILESIAKISGTIDRLKKVKPEGHEIEDEKTAEENQQTAAQAIGGFVFSKEATSKPVDDDAFVNMLYKVFMGREADAEGLAYWKGQLADGAAREAVFNGFLGSEEFQKVCADSFIAVGDPIPVPTDSVEE